MGLILNVPFAEKEEAKQLGAKWDQQRKVWYAPNYKEFHKFSKWIPDCYVLVTDYFYIMIATKECFKCHSNVQVIGFAFDKFYIFDDEKDRYIYQNMFTWMSSIKNEYGIEAQKYLANTYNFKVNYSKFLKSSYYSVTCPKCNVIQGEYYLFDDTATIKAPFASVDKEVCKRITLLKVKIPYAFPANLGWYGNNRILENATIVECDDDRVGEYFCSYK